MYDTLIQAKCCHLLGKYAFLSRHDTIYTLYKASFCYDAFILSIMHSYVHDAFICA